MMLFGSEKSLAFSADRKMAPNVAIHPSEPLKSCVRYFTSSVVCTMG